MAAFSVTMPPLAQPDLAPASGESSVLPVFVLGRAISSHQATRKTTIFVDILET